MKAAAFVFLLMVCGTVMHAQSSAAPSADVTISISEGSADYCAGEDPSPVLPNRGPDDIALRLPLKVSYENHRPETIILPLWNHYLMRMTVDGQNGSTVLRNATREGMDVKGVMGLSSPDRNFTIITGGKYVWSTGVEGVSIRVLDHSSRVDLRGKTVQIVMTRDFRSLAADVVEKLNEKWKNFGTVWTGVAESNTLMFYIPPEPLTRNCTH
jgi:hypothetical protein